LLEAIASFLLANTIVCLHYLIRRHYTCLTILG
jgi:hypothetical protein